MRSVSIYYSHIDDTSGDIARLINVARRKISGVIVIIASYHYYFDILLDERNNTEYTRLQISGFASQFGSQNSHFAPQYSLVK